MSRFKPKTTAENVESRVNSEEALASSPISIKQEDNSHQTSVAGGSLHDPTLMERVIQDSDSGEPEILTPKIEDLTDEDYKTDFSESDEHMVCLQNARLSVLSDNESDRTLRAIRQFYTHHESHRKALGTLLHAALVTRRLVFGLSRPLLAKLLRLDPNVPSISSDEINHTLYCRVRKACHESGFIKILLDSEAGPRGQGKVAIFQVQFKPVQAAVCKTRVRSLPTLLAFQYAQVESYRAGRVVPTWEVENSPSEEALMRQKFMELVKNRETLMQELQKLTDELTGALISDQLARSACEAVDTCDAGILGWSIKEIIDHFHVVGVQQSHLDQPSRYSVRYRDVANNEDFVRLTEQLETAFTTKRHVEVYRVLLEFLKLHTFTLRQKVCIAAWLDDAVIVEKKLEVWNAIVRNDRDGYPVPPPAKRR